MQLVSAGRNEPCPCGSGRKYKKCCLLAGDDAVAGDSADLAALVDRAIADDDWEPVHEVFDQGFALFEPMAPLEHVRFRQDQLGPRTPDRAALSRLCTAGWQRRCEQEIAYVLTQYDLEPGERDGLRMASYLLRRFGARSPLVEEVAELQAAERGVRARKLGDTMSTLGVTASEVDAGWNDIFGWIGRERPVMLMFADWVALRCTPAAEVEELWQSCVVGRVCDAVLALLEQPELPDARQWVQVAALALLSPIPRLGLVLPQLTSPRVRGDDEQLVLDAVIGVVPGSDDRLRDAVGRIVKAMEARRDYAGAAMLREAAQRIRTGNR
jgi:hypothetical protein